MVPSRLMQSFHRLLLKVKGFLDPYRYIIQKDVDVTIIPDPGDETMLDITLQEAKAMCDTCPVDQTFWLPGYWKVTIGRI